MERTLHTVHVSNPWQDSAPSIGPFCVMARTANEAFRIVRKNYAVFLRNHIGREFRTLECNGFRSDRIGKRLPY